MVKVCPAIFIASFLALYLGFSYSMILPSSRDEISGVDHNTPGTSSSSPSPSPPGTDLSGSPDYSTNFGIVPKDGDLPARTKSSPSAGHIITVAVCWITLNSFIALCLVWARKRKKASRKKSKKAARKNALELPAGDIPAELQEDSLYELDIALPELNEDTCHEMFVPPLELSGDM